MVAVGLAPLLVYWLAWLIGLAIRRKARRPRASNPPVEIEGEPPQRVKRQASHMRSASPLRRAISIPTRRNEVLHDSPLEGDGFELPVPRTTPDFWPISLRAQRVETDAANHVLIFLV